MSEHQPNATMRKVAYLSVPVKRQKVKEKISQGVTF